MKSYKITYRVYLGSKMILKYFTCQAHTRTQAIQKFSIENDLHESLILKTTII